EPLTGRTLRWGRRSGLRRLRSGHRFRAGSWLSSRPAQPQPSEPAFALSWFLLPGAVLAGGRTGPGGLLTQRAGPRDRFSPGVERAELQGCRERGGVSVAGLLLP